MTFVAFVERPFFALLVSLLLLFLIGPLFEGRIGNLILDVLLSFVLLSAIRTVAGRRLSRATFALIIPSFLSLWLLHLVRNVPLQAFSMAISAIAMGFITVVILRVVVRSTAVTTDTIFGAACAYMTIGLTYALAYSFLETVVPGSLSFSGRFGGLNVSPHAGLSLLVYYSFITLTTLGYGDITPATGVARNLAALEAITGQLYVAILIARLVSLHVQGTGRGR